jgi:hypothetical protein
MPLSTVLQCLVMAAIATASRTSAGGALRSHSISSADETFGCSAQEERRRQVVGLRERGLTYEAIAAQTGLTRTGVFNICRRFAQRGMAGLKSGPRGPEPLAGREAQIEVFDLPSYCPEL